MRNAPSYAVPNKVVKTNLKYVSVVTTKIDVVMLTQKVTTFAD